MLKNKAFEAWKTRMSFFAAEFPFGPIKNYKNEDGKLHRDDGPAYISPTRVTWFKNGKKHGIDADKYGSISYYYEDIRIPSHYWNKPEKLTINEVLKNENAEIRYVGIKIIGIEKVMQNELTKIIHIDKEKNQVLFSIDKIFIDPIFFVKVVNSTQETDGTYKNYFIAVPPTMKTCKQAVAWTFGLDEDDYNPQQET